MTTPMAVGTLQTKSHDDADEVRTPDKTRLEVVNLEGFTIGRMTLEPGWRWSECVKPVANTESCQASHAGYAISGRLTVRLNDGTQATIEPGSAFTIPPGHDAWVDGNEQFVGIEVMSATTWAKE